MNKRRASAPSDGDEPMGGLRRPIPMVIADFAPLEEMGGLEQALEEVEAEHRAAAMQREIELINLRTEARGFNDYDARCSPWVFSNETANFALFKTNTEAMIGEIVSATESIRARMGTVGAYDPLPPWMYNMVVYHEEDIANAMGDVMPKASLSVWKTASAAVDTYVWALLKLIRQIGLSQDVRIVPGYYRMALRRQEIRYDIPLTHRIAVAAMYVSTLTQPLIQYALGSESRVSTCVGTWNPDMAKNLSRVNTTEWGRELSLLMEDDM